MTVDKRQNRWYRYIRHELLKRLRDRLLYSALNAFRGRVKLK